MTTRTIVTSQPDVACDVCERRLLRGEHSDVFLAAGRRRTVCELCAPRAVHEGWMRERDHSSMTLPPMRPRRGRSFIERLRQVGRPPLAMSGAAGAADYEPAPDSDAEREPYDFLDGYSGEPAAAPEHAGEATAVTAASAPSDLERAIAAFNSGEYPRRVAGVARSLGAPEVNVRTTEHASSVIAIVVAWELCWYRYEVDLDDVVAQARAVAQGTELSELAREDRVVNAVADDAGALTL